MFWYRLKNEFVENRRLLGLLWLAMAAVTWSFYRWWFGDLAGENTTEVVSSLALFGAGMAALGLITTSFKRDDLKSPEAFWATRPIRSLPYFGAKLVFIQLVFTLPCGIIITSFGLTTGIGGSALLQGLEMFLWMLFATTLLSASCMAFAGSGRSFFCTIAFFGSIMLPSALLGSDLAAGLKRFIADKDQIIVNLAVALVTITAFVVFLAIRQIRDKHAPSRIRWFAAAGFFCFLLVAFAPIPGANRLLSSDTKVTPRVTSLASSQQNGIYTSGVATGTLYGAKKVTVPAKLTFPEMPWENASTATHIDRIELKVHDTDGVVCAIEPGMLESEETKDGLQTRLSGLGLNIATCDRQPGRSGSISSRSDEEKAKILQNLPMKKVRVTGTITLAQERYRPIGQGHLDEAFEQNAPGISMSYVPDASRMKNSIDAGNGMAISRVYAPPLLTSTNSHRTWLNCRQRLVHPVCDVLDQSYLDGSSGSQRSLFGSNIYREIRRLKDQSAYYLERLREAGYNKSLAEWQREAVMIFEVLDHTSRIIIPVDAECEIPDPVKVREMMLKGEL